MNFLNKSIQPCITMEMKSVFTYLLIFKLRISSYFLNDWNKSSYIIKYLEYNCQGYEGIEIIYV